jgi:hypothetical protein
MPLKKKKLIWSRQSDVHVEGVNLICKIFVALIIDLYNHERVNEKKIYDKLLFQVGVNKLFLN